MKLYDSAISGNSYKVRLAAAQLGVPLLHKPDSPERAATLAARRDGGWAALRVMEAHLARRPFFAGDYSIADIALFAYTHVSHEGGFPLGDFPNVRAWLARVRAQPGFVAMGAH